MKKSKFSETQIVSILKQGDAGMPIKELCRKHGFSDAAFYAWRKRFGGMDLTTLPGIDRLSGSHSIREKAMPKIQTRR